MLEYNSLQELYDALEPAFKAKIRLLKNNNINNVTKDDIWTYLKDTKWTTAVNLGISDMVSDIMNVSFLDIEKYLDR